MKKRFLVCLAIGVLMFGMAGAASATLVTSLPGGTIVPMPVTGYIGDGPITFGSGITWSSTYSGSGFGYDNGYGFGSNGSWDGLSMAGLNISSGTMTFEFSSPVMGVGGFLNYVSDLGFGTPEISVYDSTNTLLESYVPTFLTGGGTNTGQFFGFVEDIPIKYFKLSNAYIGITDLTIGADGAPIPEPSTMILFGFGLVGIAGITRRKLKK